MIHDVSPTTLQTMRNLGQDRIVNLRAEPMHDLGLPSYNLDAIIVKDRTQREAVVGMISVYATLNEWSVKTETPETSLYLISSHAANFPSLEKFKNPQRTMVSESVYAAHALAEYMTLRNGVDNPNGRMVAETFVIAHYVPDRLKVPYVEKRRIHLHEVSRKLLEEAYASESDTPQLMAVQRAQEQLEHKYN